MEASSHKRATPSTRRLRDAVRAALRDGCSTQATKAKLKKKKASIREKKKAKPKKKFVLKPLYQNGAKVMIKDRRVLFLALVKSKRAKKFGRVLPDDYVDSLGLPTLHDVAAYLRPRMPNMVTRAIFQRKCLKSLPGGVDGVEWLGWTVENMRPGVKEEDKWLFVAVEKVEE